MGRTYRGDDRKRHKENYLRFKDKRNKRRITEEERREDKNNNKRYEDYERED